MITRTGEIIFMTRVQERLNSFFYFTCNQVLM